MQRCACLHNREAISIQLSHLDIRGNAKKKEFSLAEKTKIQNKQPERKPERQTQTQTQRYERQSQRQKHKDKIVFT